MSVLFPSGGRIHVASDRERRYIKSERERERERRGEERKNCIVYESRIAQIKFFFFFTVNPQVVYHHSDLPSGSLYSNENAGRVLILARQPPVGQGLLVH